ncbi:MAG: hypothetical protein J5617_03700 [Bacilli bacterium]|nr:hypothetical protein [Bacilli bacterium]
MEDFYAIVDGKFCFKLMPASVNDVPERSIKTDWFKDNYGDPSDIYWAPVQDAQNNYACKLIMDQWFNDDTNPDPNGVYMINYSLNGDTVNKISNNW